MKKVRAGLLAVLAFGFASAALAVDGLPQHFGDYDSCFARQYSAGHLAKNPKQTVTSIRFDHTPSSDEYARSIISNGEVDFTVSVNFVDSAKDYGNSGTCRPNGDKLTCHIECDGGGFDVKSKGADSILIYTGKYGFRVTGCGFDDIRGVTQKTDDKIFLLHRLPANQC